MPGRRPVFGFTTRILHPRAPSVPAVCTSGSGAGKWHNRRVDLSRGPAAWIRKYRTPHSEVQHGTFPSGYACSQTVPATEPGGPRAGGYCIKTGTACDPNTVCAGACLYRRHSVPVTFGSLLRLV